MNFINLFGNKNKQIYSCNSLNHHLQFRRNSIEPCCCANVSPILVPDMNNKDWLNQLTKARKEHIKMFEKGILPENCLGCINIKPYEKEKDFKINFITLNQYIQCNCACIYCTQGNVKASEIVTEPQKTPVYDILPYIKELYKNDLIDKENLVVDFQGGDISVLEGAEIIIEEFLNNGVKQFQFLTSNIRYMPIIEKILKMNKGKLGTSLDCGSAELYKRIKQTDKFDETIENLKRYLKEVNPGYLTVKYIIINGVNDNLEEFNKFFDKMLEIGIKNIALDINYRDTITRKSTFIIPNHYYDIFENCKNRCRNNNMNTIIPPYTEQLLTKGNQSTLSQ